MSAIKWPEKHPCAGQPIELRDYQVETINKFIENPQSIQEIATGAGKTIITAALCQLVEPYGRTLTIVPNKSLVTQTEEDFLACNLDVGVYYGDRKELGRFNTIATWQSLNVLEKKSKDDETRAIYITKSMVTKYGATKQCGGCRYALGLRGSKCTHTDICRKIFLEMSEEPGNG